MEEELHNLSPPPVLTTRSSSSSSSRYRHTSSTHFPSHEMEQSDNLPPVVPRSLSSSSSSSRYRHTQTHKPIPSSRTDQFTRTHHLTENDEPTNSTTTTSSSSAPPGNLHHNHRHYNRTTRVLEEAEIAQQQKWDCSGKGCRSCSANLVADCVAVSCCPLAVVSFLALAFIKVPYVMGRRCLGRRRKRKKTTKTVKKEDNNVSSSSSSSRRKSCGSKKSREINTIKNDDDVGGRCDSEFVKMSTQDIVFEFGEAAAGKWMGLEMDIKEQDNDDELEMRMRSNSSSLCRGGSSFLEVDNMLLELYQVGHLGFGRLSFTGINNHHHTQLQPQQQQQQQQQ